MQQVFYPVKVWLVTGIFMVFIQILVGGITRLTESGLSITKWEVVSGTLPPMSDASWQLEFEKYKDTPQYKEINEGMSLSQFKFIYFWEYIHRLWARFMGFVFIIPFMFFYRKRWIIPPLMKDLGIVILLAALAAVFGWVMVASGLINRPWVNAYKLSIHLIIAFSVIAYLFWTFLKYSEGYPADRNIKRENVDKLAIILFVALFLIQLVLGGMMSGMKVAVVYPEWPLMNGVFWPEILNDGSQWTWSNLNHYDQNEFAPAFTHFFHRLTAYLLCIVFVFLLVRFWSNAHVGKNMWQYRFSILAIGGALLLQATLGIFTVLHSLGSVPVFLGVAHQAGAVIVMGTIIYFIFTLKKEVD